MRGRSAKNVLIIFVKYPEPGSVKTRLAKRIGDERAASLYRYFAETVITNTRSGDYGRAVFYSPPDRRRDIRDWLKKGPALYPQANGDLGRRLSAAFKTVFGRGAKKAVVIGSDGPMVDRKLIRGAFAKLGDRECVIGPSRDGGYYLLGLTGPHEELFKEISWGGGRAFSQTMERIGKAGLRCGVLEESFDVDVWNDLLLLKKRLKDLPPDTACSYDKLRRGLDSV